MITTANPTPPSPAAHASVSPSLELAEARQRRDALKTLLRREQAARADFLVALADFDGRRGWERLGHASLFGFLHVELRLSRNAAFWRLSAARLLQRHPQVIEPLRDGRLCLSTAAELAKVLTADNLEAVLPRYYRLSAREAAEVTAELQPREQPPLRTVVTSMDPERRSGAPLAGLLAQAAQVGMLAPQLFPARTEGAVLTSEPTLGPRAALQLAGQQVAPSARPSARLAAPRDDLEPLTADLRRLHVTVSRQFLKKLDAARGGLSHAIPGATTEQVLEAALDLLLEKQAQVRGQVKRPRSVVAAPAPAVPAPVAAKAADSPGCSSGPLEEARSIDGTTGSSATDRSPSGTIGSVETDGSGTAPLHRRTGPREPIPAAIRRAVWERDRGCCTWLLDGGGRCGSTHRLELDHVVPWARGGESTPANLRLVCARHNQEAARQAFGERCQGRYAAQR